MSNININIEEFQCESPIITNLNYVVQSEKEFTISYTSLGAIYQANVDPLTTIEMWYSVDGGTLIQYNATTLQFNETNLVVDYSFNFHPATTSLYVELRLITNYCTSTINQTIPNGI